jgi:hypothetical protein
MDAISNGNVYNDHLELSDGLKWAVMTLESFSSDYEYEYDYEICQAKRMLYAYAILY